MRVSEGLNLVEDNLRLRKSPSLKTFRSQVRRIERYLGELELSEVKSATIRAYQDRRIRQGAAPGTVNRELVYLKRATNLAYEDEKLERRPVFHKLREDNVREGTLEPEHLDRVLAQLAPVLQDVATFAYYSGWRRREILDLTWDAVEVDFVRCSAAREKTRRAKLCPLRGPIRAVIERRLKERYHEPRRCNLVFHDRGHKLGNFNRAWLRACQEAGFRDLRLHDFRRSFCTNGIRAGIPIPTLMALTGHRTVYTFVRYGIIDGRDLELASGKLEAYCREKEANGRPREEAPSARTAADQTQGG